MMGQSRLTRRPARRVLPEAQRACRTAPPVRPSSSSRTCSSPRATATTCAATSRSRSRSSRPPGSTSPTTGRCARTTTTSPASARATRVATASNSAARSPVCARSCSCCATTPTSLARRRTSPTRRCPSCGGATPRPRRTTSTTTSPRAARRSGTTWATATGRPRPNYATVVLQRLQPDAHRQRPARSVPGRRSRSSVRSPPRVRARSACVSPVARSRPRSSAVAPTCSTATARSPPTTVRRSSDHRPLGDSDVYRDIDVMPDGQGYVVLDEYGGRLQVRIGHVGGHRRVAVDGRTSPGRTPRVRSR